MHSHWSRKEVSCSCYQFHTLMLFMPLSVLHKQNSIENLKVQPIFSKFYFYWHQIAFIVIGFNRKEAMGSIVCKIWSNDVESSCSFVGFRLILLSPYHTFWRRPARIWCLRVALVLTRIKLLIFIVFHYR